MGEEVHHRLSVEVDFDPATCWNELPSSNSSDASLSSSPTICQESYALTSSCPRIDCQGFAWVRFLPWSL